MHVQVDDFVPFISWVRQYGRPYLKADLLAGLTVAVVAVSQSMAYALIAGLPVHHGLYASCPYSGELPVGEFRAPDHRTHHSRLPRGFQHRSEPGATRKFGICGPRSFSLPDGRRPPDARGTLERGFPAPGGCPESGGQNLSTDFSQRISKLIS